MNNTSHNVTRVGVASMQGTTATTSYLVGLLYLLNANPNPNPVLTQNVFFPSAAGTYACGNQGEDEP